MLARGSRVNAPRVGAFTRADGALLGLQRLRDTAQPAFAAKAALDASQVPERPDHEQLLALLRRKRRVPALPMKPPGCDFSHAWRGAPRVLRAARARVLAMMRRPLPLP